MYVETLDLKNFRNFKTLSLSLSPGTNIFYGSNAQGKTNILEAIYLAGTTKSHRGSKDRDIILMGEEEAHIRMVLNKHENDYRIDMHLRKHKSKGVAVGGIPVKRASELYGIASIVFFSPEDLNIIKNGPQERRKFLDSLLCGIDKIYLSDLARYNKCLNQKSKLLHSMYFSQRDIPELDIWDEQIASYGCRIIEKRKEFIEEIQPVIQEIHSTLTGGKEQLSVKYEPNTQAEEFRARQQQMREADIRMKSSNVGPHRDDLCISAGGMDLRTFGSQGQQRTAALSLKMSEIRTIEQKIKDMPVLLLDDVLSELDRDRQNYLLGCIKNTQTLITCTGLDEFVQNRFQADRTFHVVQGDIE